MAPLRLFTRKCRYSSVAWNSFWNSLAGPKLLFMNFNRSFKAFFGSFDGVLLAIDSTFLLAGDPVSLWCQASLRLLGYPLTAGRSMLAVMTSSMSVVFDGNSADVSVLEGKVVQVYFDLKY